MAHRCTPSSRFLQARTDATIVASRSHGSHQRAVRSASSRSRLDLPGIVKEAGQCLRFPACREPSRTPPVERHGTPRNRPTRTGRQQQGRAPNQDKRRLGARPAAAAVAGREDEGATLYWLVLVNERMRWLGWGRRAADAGLPMRLEHWMYMWRLPWHAARGWTGCMALSERWSWPWALALI